MIDKGFYDARESGDLSVDAVRRSLSEREPDDHLRPRPARATKGDRRRAKNGWDRDRKPLPVAGVESSSLAQNWVDAGERAGYPKAANVNWLAYRIEEKIAADKFLQKLIEVDRRPDMVRLVNKMTEKFWDEYVHSIKARDIVFFYLDEAWDDVREYAHTCLRAAYLKQHGRVVPPPEYPNQQEFQASLTALRTKAAIIRLEQEAEDYPEGEPKKLDSHRKGVLKSRLREKKTRESDGDQ